MHRSFPLGVLPDAVARAFAAAAESFLPPNGASAVEIRPGAQPDHALFGYFGAAAPRARSGLDPAVTDGRPPPRQVGAQAHGFHSLLAAAAHARRVTAKRAPSK